MFKKIDFDAIFKEMIEEHAFDEILKGLDNQQKEEILKQCRDGYYIPMNNTSISNQKFYNEIKSLLKIERKMDVEEKENNQSE